MKFRNLKEEEIDVRISHFTEKGAILLLYKDARVDMDILDETVGALNWQRKHTRDNANCTIEIYDEKKGQWIGKEDTGTESFTEKQKGLASDSFKRAGFNWGIGRELYTSPFIFVAKENMNIYKNRDGKPATYDKFQVSNIEIKNKKIVDLEITNTTNKKVVFKMGRFIKGDKSISRDTLLTEVTEAYTVEELADLMKCTAGEVSDKLARQTDATLRTLMRNKIIEERR